MTPRAAAPISALLDPDPRRRLTAVKRTGFEASDRYALRNALATDSDGRVRARAANRLGSRRGLAMIDALLEAAEHDELPSVREAAWRSLARARPRHLGDVRVCEAARRGCATEPVWWVRMAIASLLARAPGAEQISDLRDVLLDPFWRVRHTAVKALVALGAESAPTREQILAAPMRSDVEGAALIYLERAWLGEHAGSLEPSLPAAPPVDPLWDPDPAVISARLEDPESKPGLGLLIELLADAHESTRELALSRLEERGDLREHRVALQWLDEPRIPHASACVARLCGRLGDRAAELVAEVFADPPGNGALCWAAAWVGATRSGDFLESVIGLLDHREPRVREAAIGSIYLLGNARGALDRLVEIAADGDDGERLAAVSTLVKVAPELAKRLTRLIDIAGASPRLRRLLTREVAARHRHRGWLLAAATDVDAATRAAALRSLSLAGELSDDARATALADADPWIREAALDATSAPRLAFDADPLVRRAALRLCPRHDPSTRCARLAATAALDPRLRADAAGLLDPASVDELAALLQLSADRVPMVRAAAAGRLESCAEADETALDDAVRSLAAAHAGDVVIAAMTWLCRRFDAGAAAALEAAWGRVDLAARSREHLRALRLALPDSIECSVPAASPRPRPAPRSLPPLVPGHIESRRELGRSGLIISPLVISGVKDISMGSLRHAYDAGVNVYFWEPRYHQLGAFLRRPEIAAHTHVVAGSYHGTAAAIEKDVDTALRRLRRDHIDLFLIFWVRSAERLSAEVWDCLQRLKREGKIRACGFSSHHRDIAAEAISSNPWDAIMVRHSAAHTGAEESLLALAEERDVGVLAFTSLCYGRLLQPSPARQVTRAPDCYRYSLGQPGISAVVSAPARHRELVENLEVLGPPTLTDATAASMREHGAWVYAKSKDFGALVRRTPRELPRAAASRLFASEPATSTK